MATTDELIGDALNAIEAIRPALAVLGDLDPRTSSIVSVALTLLYEGLVHIRSALLAATQENLRATLAAKAERAIQELAALKFGAMAPNG